MYMYVPCLVITPGSQHESATDILKGGKREIVPDTSALVAYRPSFDASRTAVGEEPANGRSCLRNLAGCFKNLVPAIPYQFISLVA